MDLHYYLPDIEKSFNFLKERGILFLPELTNEDLLLLFFDSWELIKALSNDLKEEKISSCLKLIEMITLKRITLDDRTDENIRKGLMAALLWFFDFKTNVPLTSILNAYQEDIEKGNNITLIIREEDFFDNEWLVLITILLCDRIHNILNASPIKKNDELKNQCWSYIKNKYILFDIESINMIFELFKIIYNFIKINVKNEKNEQILHKVIDSIIKTFFYDNETFIKLVSFNTDLKDKINYFKRIYANIPKTILFRIEDYRKVDVINSREVESSNLYALYLNTSNAENDLNSKLCFILDNKKLKILKLLYEAGKEKIGISKQSFVLNINLQQKEENYYHCVLPPEFKDNLNREVEFETIRFICKKCKTVDFLNYCVKCKCNKEIYYFCDKCNERSLTRICAKCHSNCLKRYKEKTNYYEIISQLMKILNVYPDNNFTISYEPRYFLEHPIKTLLRVKNGIFCDKDNLAVIKINVLPYNFVVEKESIYKISYDEILLPISIKNELTKIKNYIGEEIEILYPHDTKLLKKLDNIVIISNSTGLIFYPLKVAGFINTNYAVISPRLYKEIFNEFSLNNTVKLFLLNDVLLNLYNLDCPIIIKSYSKNYDAEKSEDSLSLLKREYLVQSSNEIKNFLEYASKLIEETSMIVTCKRCGNIQYFTPITSRCNFCRTKITYDAKSEKLKKFLADVKKISFDSAFLARLCEKLIVYNETLNYERKDYVKLDKYF